MESLIILISQYSYLEIIEGTLGSNAVYQDESLTILHVQISHGCELFLEKIQYMYKIRVLYWFLGNRLSIKGFSC